MDDQLRADTILETAQKLQGAITMPVAEALFLNVHRSIVSRLLTRLTAAGALFPCWQAFGNQKVWLTTTGMPGNPPGVRRYLRDAGGSAPEQPESIVRADGRVTRNRGWSGPRPKMPPTFMHDQMAGTLVAGYGRFGTRYDSEFERTSGEKIPDGLAWTNHKEGLIIEVERMIRVHPHVWRTSGGLVQAIVARARTGSENWCHLVALPYNHCETLVGYVNETASDVFIHPGRGWWSVPIEDIEADPTWNPIGSSSERTMPGIRSLKSLLRVIRRQSDQELKKAAAERKAAAASKPALSTDNEDRLIELNTDKISDEVF